jgi:hypothetical protein
VGIDGGDSLYSWVQKAEPSSRDPNPSLYQRFTLVVVPHGPAIAAAALFVAALVFFLFLVKWTTILQDVSAPLRPDGQPPYSLARMQMAFWFFLVVTAWFLLFLVTRDMDTLTSSVLILMGISAGTAVGSAIMDAGTTLDAADRIVGIPATTDRQGLAQQVRSLRESLAKSRIRPTKDDQEREAKHAEVRGLAEELALAERQSAFFAQRPWLRLMYDILGDDGHVSFHRFQIAVWTLVLGIVFEMRVLGELSMPDFSATILGVMGISSGTYLGFKLPAASAAGAKDKT